MLRRRVEVHGRRRRGRRRRRDDEVERLPALARLQDVFQYLRVGKDLTTVDEALVGLGHAQFIF